MNNNKNAPLYGLVLCGGKSTRMGTDKCDMDYHGRPQGQYLYEQLRPLCEKTFLSMRKDQDVPWSASMPVIRDSDEFKGPFNGLLSAHKAHPEAAWLVVACDLPMLNTEILQDLTVERAEKEVATAYATEASGLPEPLVAIWEPEGLAKAIRYLEDASSSCPRKFLIRAGAALVTVADDQYLMNANSPAERDLALKHLS